jgi:hypothetical protein
MRVSSKEVRSHTVRRQPEPIHDVGLLLFEQQINYPTASYVCSSTTTKRQHFLIRAPRIFQSVGQNGKALVVEKP